MKKKLLIFAAIVILLAAIACVSVSAADVASGTCGADEDNLTWVLDDTGTLTISGEGKMADWKSTSTLPWNSKRSSIKAVIIGDGVTNIGRMAFYACTKLESVAIPNSVTSIGINAFSGCSSLKNVTIPNSVTSIGGIAFQGCNSLTSINIPASVSSIGSDVFNGCDSLESITVDEKNTAYSSEDGILFDYEKTTIIRYPANKQGTSYDLPSSVEIIVSGAFQDCKLLTNITLQDGVKSIGNQAFSNCSSLTSMSIPADVASIGNHAFSGCSSLETITVDANNTAYVSDVGVLFNYDKTTLLHYPAKKAGETYDIPSTVTSIGAYAFDYCRLLTNITIPEGITSIGNGTFRCCSSLKSINIPDGVTSIGTDAFQGCTSLESINIPDGVTSIGTYAFQSCISLESINIPNGVTSIGGYAFQNCRLLTSMTIPEGVPTIFANTFYGCNNLAKVTIPASVKSIMGSAFYGCFSLAEIHFDGTEEEWNSVTKSANWDKNAGLNTENGTYTVTFKLEVVASGTCGDNLTWTLDEAGTLTISGTGAMPDWTSSSTVPWNSKRSSIKTVIIGDGVTVIGRFAFSTCSALESVTIGNNVTEIHGTAFSGCSSLTSINMPANVTSIANGVFNNCNSLETITVDEKNTAYSSEDGILFDYEKTALLRYPIKKSGVSYTVPSTVTSLGHDAFYGCKLLTSITLHDGVTSIGNNAFRDCTALVSMHIPAKLTSISSYAFQGCTSLESINIPDGVTGIGISAFQNCHSLTSMTIPEGVTKILANTFYGCSKLAKVTIPVSVTSIGNSAFYGCTRLEEIHFDGTEEEWNSVTKSADWDKNAGVNTENGTYTVIYNYNLGEFLTNLGASIRPESEEHSAGLRFGASFNKADFGIEGTYAYEGADVTFGMLVIPKYVLERAGYDNVKDYFEKCEGQKTLDIPAKKIYAQDETSVSYTAVLLDIPQSEYTSEICALPYAMVDGEYYFGDEMRASFYSIAWIARNTTYSDEAIAAIVDEKKKVEAEAMAVELDKIITVVSEKDDDIIIDWPDDWQ